MPVGVDQRRGAVVACDGERGLTGKYRLQGEMKRGGRRWVMGCCDDWRKVWMVLSGVPANETALAQTFVCAPITSRPSDAEKGVTNVVVQNVVDLPCMHACCHAAPPILPA